MINKDKSNQPLFAGFGDATEKEWTDKAIFDLKGADFNKRLVWKNLNKIPVPPFYVNDENREFLRNSGVNSGHVSNYRRIKVGSAKTGNKNAKKGHTEWSNYL